MKLFNNISTYLKPCRGFSMTIRTSFGFILNHKAQVVKTPLHTKHAINLIVKSKTITLLLSTLCDSN